MSENKKKQTLKKENSVKWNILSWEKKRIINKQNIRFGFFWILSLLTYTLFIRNLFWEKEYIISWVLFCILFIELIFLSIDVRWVKKTIMRWILFVFWLIISFLIPNPVRQVITALWLSLGTIGCLLVFLRSYFKNVRKIDRLTYFTRWGYIFTLLTSITFWFAILWINSKFPFQCNQISKASETLLKKSTSWLFFWKEEEWDKSIFEIKEDIQELEWWGQDKNTIINEARSVFKSNMVDGFIETKNSINNKVCEAIISQIDEIYQNPVFQVGAVFWIYLLFYWVIRLLVRIITIIWYIIFIIVKYMWLYKVVKTDAVVEDVL